MNRQIKLVGGPCDGMCHELYGNIMPEEIGMPDESGNGDTHWYRIDLSACEKAYFDRTEKKK